MLARRLAQSNFHRVYHVDICGSVCSLQPWHEMVVIEVVVCTVSSIDWSCNVLVSGRSAWGPNLNLGDAEYRERGWRPRRQEKPVENVDCSRVLPTFRTSVQVSEKTQRLIRCNKLRTRRWTLLKPDFLVPVLLYPSRSIRLLDGKYFGLLYLYLRGRSCFLVFLFPNFGTWVTQKKYYIFFLALERIYEHMALGIKKWRPKITSNLNLRFKLVDNFTLQSNTNLRPSWRSQRRTTPSKNSLSSGSCFQKHLRGSLRHNYRIPDESFIS